MSDERDQRVCHYCRLPLVSRSILQADGPLFCCFGCRFAASLWTGGDGADAAAQRTLTRLGLAVFFAMNVMVFTLAMWTQDVYDDDQMSSARAKSLFDLFRYASLLFSGPVVVLLGEPLIRSAMDDLRRRAITTDLLIALGVSAAFAYSVVSVFSGGGHVYFEVGCMVLVAVTLGRWLEAEGKQRTTAALCGLEKLLPQTARVVSWNGGTNADGAFDRGGRGEGVVVGSPGSDEGGTAAKEEDVAIDGGPGVGEGRAARDVPLAEVGVGMIVRVFPGERIPVDGEIARGEAAVDRQIVSGESEPSVKQPGDQVEAGTLNLDGDLLVRVTKPIEEGIVRRMIQSVQEAALGKCRWQTAADRVASWFVPGVAAIAGATFVVHTWMNGFAAGVLSSLAVMLIACPCALGIAMPMAIHAAIGSAARRGVLFRSGDAMERLARARVFCFDKTGTLTTGQPAVERFVAADEADETTALDAAASLASASLHGLSIAICDFAANARRQGSLSRATLGAERVRTAPGRGLAGRVEGISGDIDRDVRLGSPRWMEESGLKMPEPLEEVVAAARCAGHPLACIGWCGVVRGVFVFREALREQAAETLQALRNGGVHVCILTGDHAARAGSLQEALGVEVAADLLPEDKLSAIREWRRRIGPVVMVGDGINDAPALAEADVGIALRCGADISRDAADVCLLGDDLRQIPILVDLARQTMRVVRQNLFWAFAYNVGGVALAVTGWLNPIWAAAAMVVSSLLVISNSLRLAGDSSRSAESPSTEDSESTKSPDDWAEFPSGSDPRAVESAG